MPTHVLQHGGIRMVCVAVAAAVAAGIIHADVYAFRTSAFRSLVRVLAEGERNARDFAYKRSVYTPGGGRRNC